MRTFHSQAAWVKHFQLSSDEFFQRYDFRQILGSDAVSLVFIDGLHEFDQTPEDFSSTIDKHLKLVLNQFEAVESLLQHGSKSL